ncbi:alpha/beta fold hydrolase [Streptomyces goshikiensis]
MTSREVPTPHGLTRINSCGPLGAPPLVLLPGGGATSTVWGGRRGRGSGADAPGACGRPGGGARAQRSGRGRAIRTPEDLAGWLDAVLDGLDGLGAPGPVTLAGHSYGAWIAAHYATRHPRRLARLVLLDPTQVFAGLRPGYVLRALPMLARPTPARIRSFLRWETGGADLDPAWLRLRDETARFPTVRPVTGPRPGPAGLDRFPLHILFAEQARCHDSARAAATARAALPGARVEMLPGVSHHALPLLAAEAIARSLAA